MKPRSRIFRSQVSRPVPANTGFSGIGFQSTRAHGAGSATAGPARPREPLPDGANRPATGTSRISKSMRLRSIEIFLTGVCTGPYGIGPGIFGRGARHTHGITLFNVREACKRAAGRVI